MRTIKAIVLSLPIACAAHCVLAGPLNLPVTKILPPSGTPSSQWFGTDVDIDENHLVVTGPTAGNREGKAYLYTLGPSGWEYETDFSAPTDDLSYLNFGREASVSAGSADAPTRILVSSDGGGRVFELSNNAWVETALLPSFGAIDGNTAVSAVPGPAAVVSQFEGGSWNAIATLQPLIPDGLDGGFGANIIVEGDLALISAHAHDADLNTINSGAVFTYERTEGQWQPLATVAPSDPVFRGNFGAGIDFHNGTLLVGRPAGGPAADGPFQGIAYLYSYEFGNWVESARLQASSGFLDDGFGSGVALTDNYAAVTGRGLGGEGRVYIFRRTVDDWVELGWLETGEAFTTDQFGIDIAFHGSHLVVGARLDDELGHNVGAIYVYTVPEPSTFALVTLLLMSAYVQRKRNSLAFSFTRV